MTTATLTIFGNVEIEVEGTDYESPDPSVGLACGFAGFDILAATDENETLDEEGIKALSQRIADEPLVEMQVLETLDKAASEESSDFDDYTD